MTDPIGEVLETNRRFFRALMQNEADLLYLLLADDLIYIHASSAKDNKDSLLSALLSGALLFRTLDLAEVEALDLGSWVRLSGKCSQTTFGNGRREEMAVRFTAAYVRRQDRWQLNFWQSTRLPNK
jgi:hypothetical protein